MNEVERANSDVRQYNEKKAAPPSSGRIYSFQSMASRMFDNAVVANGTFSVNWHSISTQSEPCCAIRLAHVFFFICKTRFSSDLFKFKWILPLLSSRTDQLVVGLE